MRIRSGDQPRRGQAAAQGDIGGGQRHARCHQNDDLTQLDADVEPEQRHHDVVHEQALQVLRETGAVHQAEQRREDRPPAGRPGQRLARAWVKTLLAGGHDDRDRNQELDPADRQHQRPGRGEHQGDRVARP